MSGLFRFLVYEITRKPQSFLPFRKNISSKTIPMEVEQVDHYGPENPTGEEYDKAWSKAMERNPEIDKLFNLVDIVLTKLNDDDKKKYGTKKDGNIVVDIDISNELSGVIATVFTHLRKEDAKQGADSQTLTYTATVGTTLLNIAEIIKEVEKQKIEFDFMKATPLMNIYCAFRLAFDEVRTGVTKVALREGNMKRQGIKIKKVNGKIAKDDSSRFINVAQYGVSNQHLALLQGVTFPPGRRTGLLRSLGPLTQAICLINEEAQYADKIQSALKNTIKMLPMATELTNFLRNASTPGMASGIISELGDILSMTTARATQKLYYPILLLREAWNFKTLAWSSTGPKMMAFMDEFIREKKVVFSIRSNGNAEDIAQVIFHAIYGTYLDDLGVLSQITNKTTTWKQRKDLNEVFTKRKTAKKVVIQPIQMARYSKMATSLLTKTLGNVEPMSIGRPSFAGERKRKFTDAFKTYLQTGRATSTFSSDPVQLQYALKKLKDELKDEIESDKLGKAGTTGWYFYDGVNLQEDKSFVLVETGRHFFNAI